MTAGRAGNLKVARIGNLVRVGHRQIIERGKPYTPQIIAVKCIRKKRYVRMIGSTQTNVGIKFVNPRCVKVNQAPKKKKNKTCVVVWCGVVRGGQRRTNFELASCREPFLCSPELGNTLSSPYLVSHYVLWQLGQLLHALTTYLA
jgi:hypothetical protein